MSNLKTDILALANSLQPAKYECKEIQADIYVKHMNLGEREAYFKEITNITDNKINATAFVNAVCDKNGHLIFGEEDIDEVNKLPSPLVYNVLDFFNKVNHFDKEFQQSVEESEKN